MEAKVVWKDAMGFEAELDGFHFMIDADPSAGGQQRGPKPKGLTAVSLAGCTAMDVISILKKMKVNPTYFEVATENLIAEEHPKRFLEIIVKFIFKGENLPVDSLKKAVNLSKDKYCGVMATLKPGVKISHEIFLNGQKVGENI
ncbi:MAG: OsmC family peroxiredoxin [Desulfobacteraceae bacterium]|nr:MAG: OsmC family peroxiredoxin [Desulfobacteraceae bacterium]